MYILTNNQLVVDLFEYLKATTKIYRHAPCRQLLQMSERDAKARIDLESMRSACHGFCSREAQATYTFPGIVYVLGFVFITFKRQNEQWVINGSNCAQNNLEYYFFYRKLCLCM